MGCVGGGRRTSVRTGWDCVTSIDRRAGRAPPSVQHCAQTAMRTRRDASNAWGEGVLLGVLYGSAQGDKCKCRARTANPRPRRRAPRSRRRELGEAAPRAIVHGREKPEKRDARSIERAHGRRRARRAKAVEAQDRSDIDRTVLHYTHTSFYTVHLDTPVHSTYTQFQRKSNSNTQTRPSQALPQSPGRSVPRPLMHIAACTLASTHDSASSGSRLSAPFISSAV